GAAVEPFGIKQRALVVVAEEGDLAVGHHRVEAFARPRAVADDVAEAKNLIDPLLLDMRENGLERFEVAVDVADDGAFQGGGPPYSGGWAVNVVRQDKSGRGIGS